MGVGLDLMDHKSQLSLGVPAPMAGKFSGTRSEARCEAETSFSSVVLTEIYHVVFQVSSKVIELYIYMYLGFPLGSVVEESPCNEGDLGSIPALGRYVQRDMTSLSRILAWRISCTEEPSRL